MVNGSFDRHVLFYMGAYRKMVGACLTMMVIHGRKGEENVVKRHVMIT